MRRYLLDTGPLTAYLNGRSGAVAMVEPWLREDEAATSILVYGEVTEYLLGRPDFIERRHHLRQLLAEIHPFHLTYPILDRYAEIRRALRGPGGPGIIGDIDTLLAATAIEANLTIVTTDRDFLRVPGLDVMHVERQQLRTGS